MKVLLILSGLYILYQFLRLFSLDLLIPTPIALFIEIAGLISLLVVIFGKIFEFFVKK